MEFTKSGLYIGTYENVVVAPDTHVQIIGALEGGSTVLPSSTLELQGQFSGTAAVAEDAHLNLHGAIEFIGYQWLIGKLSVAGLVKVPLGEQRWLPSAAEVKARPGTLFHRGRNRWLLQNNCLLSMAPPGRLVVDVANSWLNYYYPSNRFSVV